jgi:hypothetical protein
MIVSQKNKRIFLILLTIFSLIVVFVYTDYTSNIMIKFFPNKITSFMNANIGDSKQEIIYKFGNPTFEMPKTENVPEGLFYSSVQTSSSVLMIFFTDDKVVGIDCGSKCEPIFGLSLGDSEQKITQTLGNNFEQSFRDKIKWIYYRELNVRFALEKEKIVGVMIESFS